MAGNAIFFNSSFLFPAAVFGRKSQEIIFSALSLMQSGFYPAAIVCIRSIMLLER
jgi:hypothetical protein